MKRQLVRIALGYGAALVAASVLTTALMAYTLRYFGQEDYTTADYLRAGWRMSLEGAGFTFAPSLLLIALAEVYRWRHLLVYEAAGVLLPVPLVYSFDAGLIAEACAIGAAAGFIYWLVAGRSAGGPA